MFITVLQFFGLRYTIYTGANAHDSTFRWIFDDGSREESDGKNDSDNEWAGVFDEATRAKVDSFVEWLSSSTGVYHIAGKLGSGKSTLMKYLAGHSRVREELHKWAGTSCFSPDTSASRAQYI
jgi:polynucleotide 5'-kinase involved in rRNA processing